MSKKYILTDETIKFRDHILHRIKATKSFGNVKKGDLGGWVESEKNLSHDGNCWIANNARVWFNARVSGNGQIYNNASIWGYALIFENAKVYGETNIYDDARIYEDAEVYENAMICGNAEIYGNTKVHGKAKIIYNFEEQLNNITNIN